VLGWGLEDTGSEEGPIMVVFNAALSHIKKKIYLSANEILTFQEEPSNLS
jgi:hypothetical protein